MDKKKKTIFLGTNKNAFLKAGKKGKTAAERSKIYYVEKEKMEWLEAEQKKFKQGRNFKINKKYTKINKPIFGCSVNEIYRDIKEILIKIRKNNCPKFIHDISDYLANQTIKKFGYKLEEKEKKVVNKMITNMLKKYLNNLLVEYTKDIKYIDLFIELGDEIYKLTLIYNGFKKEFFVFNDDFQHVNKENLEYKEFKRKYPKIKNKIKLDGKYQNKKCPYCGRKLKLVKEKDIYYYACVNYKKDKCNYKSGIYHKRFI